MTRCLTSLLLRVAILVALDVQTATGDALNIVGNANRTYNESETMRSQRSEEKR